MRCTFGSMGSVRLMHESYVCGYLSVLQALSCPSALCFYNVYLSSNDYAGGKDWCEHSREPVWNDCCAPLMFLFVFQESWGGWGRALWNLTNCWKLPSNSHSCLDTLGTSGCDLATKVLRLGARLTEWCHILPLFSSSNSSLLVWSANIEVQPPPPPQSPSLWGAWSCWCLWWCLTVVPARAFRSSVLTLRISEACNWGVCKDECSIMTLQAVHIFRGKSLLAIWKL